MMFEPFSETPGDAEPIAGLVVRPAGLPDVSALAEIAVARDGGQWRDWHDRFKRDIEGMSQSSGRHLSCPAGDSPGSFSRKQLWAAEHNEECLGFARAAYFTSSQAESESASGSDSVINEGPSGWYLTGVVVRAEARRRGVGSALTKHRLDWIGHRASEVYYFVNARNQVSIGLHSNLGFTECSRDFCIPGVRFEGGCGILYVLRWTDPHQGQKST